MHRDQLIARVVEAHLGALTGAREAYINDAIYHEWIQLMIRLLEIFELAMDQENIPTAMRYRVLERIMMASPDPAETKRHMAMLKNTQLNPGWPGKTCRW